MTSGTKLKRLTIQQIPRTSSPSSRTQPDVKSLPLRESALGSIDYRSPRQKAAAAIVCLGELSEISAPASRRPGRDSLAADEPHALASANWRATVQNESDIRA